MRFKVLFCLAALAISTAAWADAVYTYGTSYTANFSLSGNTLTIKVTNNLSGTTQNIASSISDIDFLVSGGGTTSNFSSTTPNYITIGTTTGTTCGTGLNCTITSGGSSGFVVNGTSGSYDITTLTGGNPANLIIGSGPYSCPSANGDLCNPQHNPFDLVSATFMLNIAGLTSLDQISGVQFSLGTQAGVFVPGTCTSCSALITPEPASLALLSTGLLGCAGLLRRKRR